MRREQHEFTEDGEGKCVCCRCQHVACIYIYIYMCIHTHLILKSFQTINTSSRAGLMRV